MTLNANKQVRVLLTREGMSLERLAALLNENTTDRKYTQQSLSRRLNEGTMRYDEILTIIRLLGYKITIEKE